jgi:hypothetical protein
LEKQLSLFVVVAIPITTPFASNIRDEIMEKIEPLWDVKEVEVEFME